MCGIAGFTHKGRTVGEGIARRLTESIFHRGPDQQGVFQAADVTLCAVRLKIIDLGGGDQPIVSDDGQTVIVFNGEIYNHAELRQELRSLGHQFHTSCDTEVVLHAFQQWNTACFARLRGMFGVALWGLVEPPSLARSVLLALAFVLTSLSSTDFMPRRLRQEVVRPLAVKAVPIFNATPSPALYPAQSAHL